MTQPNPPDTPGPPAPPGTLAQQVSEIHAMLTQLSAEWARFRPIADAFSRGGMLAARTAARHQRRAGQSSYTDLGGPHHD